MTFIADAVENYRMKFKCVSTMSSNKNDLKREHICHPTIWFEMDKLQWYHAVQWVQLLINHENENQY